MASLVAACAGRAKVATPIPPPAVPDVSVPAGPPSQIAWTWQRAADPELVHLHVRAPAAPGAFLVPWLEGITLRPCAIVVRDGDDEVQRTQLSYDGAGRLLEVIADAHRDVLERDARGRLLGGRGLEYRWVADRLTEIVDGRGAAPREHVLRYDDDGRLVGIDSSTASPSRERRRLREQWLAYDGELLVERRWRDDDGAHGTTYFVYDERSRLVRVDVESTSAIGNRIVQPTLRMEYNGDRLVEFGNSTVKYDEGGRASAIESADGLRTEYEYACE